MSRRNLTLLLSSVFAIALTVVAFAVPVPYVLLSGGPIYNTTGTVKVKDKVVPVISITGLADREVDPTDGQLDLTTVSVDRSITLAEAMRGWIDRDQAVAPTELLYPPDKSDEEIDQEAKQQMVESQSSSKSAALLQLGIPVTMAVGSVPAGSPSTGRLQPGDELARIDGKAVTSPASLRELVGSKPVGAPVTVDYVRGGKPGSVVVTTGDNGQRRAILGIEYAITRYPFDIAIALEGVGGPSAGLMFSLGIIDKLTPGSLTGGKKIAGTGTIDAEGNVGSIGGIQQKMAAAGERKVQVFLVPDENCADAQANKPEDVQLVRVTTLTSALAALDLINKGGTPQGCAS